MAVMDADRVAKPVGRPRQVRTAVTSVSGQSNATAQESFDTGELNDQFSQNAVYSLT